MKNLLFLLVLLQYGSPQHLSQWEVDKATYAKSTEENGDRVIRFRVHPAGEVSGVEVEKFSVNGQSLPFELREENQRHFIEAEKLYPAPPGDRGMDPLPPGEGNILFFQDEFKAEILLKYKGRYDTLEVPFDKLRDTLD